MFNWNWKRLGVVAGLSLSLVVAGCGGSGDTSQDDQSAGDGDSDTSYGEEMDFEITGIEPGAGVFKASEKAVEEYDLEGWEVQASSSGVKARAIGEAIDNDELIIVTVWYLHWKFAKYDFKYLDDQIGVFGEEEIIGSMVREGLEEDMPNVYKLLDQFAWTTDDMESV